MEASEIESFDEGSAKCPNAAFTCSAKAKSRIEVVGRLGYAFGNVLPYMKGGYDVTTMRSKAQPSVDGFDDIHYHDGWVVGGGLEYLTHSIIVGIDYSHVETDTVTYSAGVAVGITRNVDATLDTVTARISYKFTPAASLGHIPINGLHKSNEQ